LQEVADNTQTPLNIRRGFYIAFLGINEKKTLERFFSIFSEGFLLSIGNNIKYERRSLP